MLSPAKYLFLNWVNVVAAVAGFLGKSVWDLYWGRRREIESATRQKRIDFLERQLAQFYWPIYLRLQKDNIVWERLLDRDKADNPLLQSVSENVESGFLLPNHDEIVHSTN